MSNRLSNFLISSQYVNSVSFILFPDGYDDSMPYTINSSNESIATIINGNVLNANAPGESTITFNQDGYSIQTNITILKLNVNIIADNKSITYGDNIPTLTYNINPNVTDNNQLCNVENIGISINRQKIGYGINLDSMAKISDLSNINISRFDSGTSTNPYINIWVTNNDYTNYAVISISPTWTKNLTNASYNSLRDEDIFIYETSGVELAATGNYPNLILGYQGTSWISSVSGVPGSTAQLKLSDLKDLEIKSPPASWFIDNTHGTGTGAPRELSTYNAYGFNWIFGNINNNGDGTLADYIISKSTLNNKYTFVPYIIRNANNGVAPTITSTLIYDTDNITIGNNPIDTSGSDAGTYSIVLNQGSFTSSFYNLSFTNGTLTINTKTLTVTNSLVEEKIYDSLTNATITGSILNGIISPDIINISSQSGAFSDANAGIEKVVVATIIIEGEKSSNYTVSQPIGLTGIIRQTILTITPSNQSTTYGSLLALGTTSFASLGLINGDSITSVTLKQNNSDTIPVTQSAGTYTGSTDGILASGAVGINLDNYTIIYAPGTLTIGVKTLTITASNQSTIYGTLLALGTTAFTSTGLINGDSITGVTLKQNNSDTIPVTQTAGTYTGPIDGIIASGAVGINLANYTIIYVYGTLTIGVKTLTITASNQSTTYGTLLALGTTAFTSSGLINSDSITSVILKQYNTDTIPVTQTVGTYTGSIDGIIASGALGIGLNNYTITYVYGILTIDKKTLIVTADNKSKDYNAVLPALTYIITGYVNGQDSSSISGVPFISTICTKQSPVLVNNSYLIKSEIGSLNAQNYSFSLINGRLTVNPITPIVNWLQSNTPPTCYKANLNDLMLHAISIDIITNNSIGYLIYSAKNLTTNEIINNLTLNSLLPSCGTYTLYATLNVTSDNYIKTPSITISKQFKVVQSNLNVKWYNPRPISHNTPLSSVQLNAICNSSTTGIYTPSSGTYLQVGNKQKLSVLFTTDDPGFLYNTIKSNVKINIT